MKLTGRMVDLLGEAVRGGGVVVLTGRKPADLDAAARLDQAGLVVFRRPPASRRTGFWITDAGRTALEAWWASSD